MPAASAVVASDDSATAMLESGVPIPKSIAVDETLAAVSSAVAAETSSEVAVPLTVAKPPVAASVGTAAPPALARRPSLVGSAVGETSASSKSKKKKGAAVTMAADPTAGGGAPNENTGRWTAEEHRLFLQGLEQHGKGWKKIASLIKSRTVVQIRTHAQKYFQKLAKARQNGEEGDVTMEGRGGLASVTTVSSVPTNTNKRRRQMTGTKRKAIQSVVASAQRQGKKLAEEQVGAPNPVVPLPAISPALAHFVLPNAPAAKSGCVPAAAAAQGNISSAALEDSLFRFLTPCPVASTESQVNDVARQAGANPITVPDSNPSSSPAGGEFSPTGVQDISLYPSWADAKDPPSWYSKGADVDALLDVADTLDWLADTGDLNETYQAPAPSDLPSAPKVKSESGAVVNNSTSVNTLPDVDSNVDSVVPPLPSLFEGHPEAAPLKETAAALGEGSGLHPSPSEPDIGHLEVFDTPMEEHDFVSTILENTPESTDHLPTLD